MDVNTLVEVVTLVDVTTLVEVDVLVEVRVEVVKVGMIRVEVVVEVEVLVEVVVAVLVTVTVEVLVEVGVGHVPGLTGTTNPSLLQVMVTTLLQGPLPALLIARTFIDIASRGI